MSLARPPRPYPGLRPFEAEEWSIFFGRERMVDESIGRLAETRVALIHGASGAGKSSLVRAGVLPKLERQHQRRGAPWLTCAMRPSGGPLWNLAAEFARLEGRPDDLDRIAALVTRFSARGATLARVAGALEGLEGRSLCVLVDQFEELFRFEKETSREEAELFAELIGRALAEPEPGDADLRVIVTMRSEFLGECARFAGLAETINRTQYLVPRLDDDGLLRAVRRPAELYGGRLDLDLAERLIASVRGREDELPLLQHGLMRMWEAASGSPRVLDGRMVEEAGGLAELLSKHADDVLAEAAPDARRERLVERLFRELTDVNAEGAAIRRPRRLRDLAAAIGVAWEELAPLIDAFRAPGVSFLTPYAPAVLAETTPIDISHEALIRCWRKIAPDGWLRAEVEDGLAWRSLLIEAEGFARDKFCFLSPAATEERGRLVGERGEVWSLRYGGSWDLVVALIDASRKAATGARRRRRAAFITMATLTLCAMVFAGAAGWEWREANHLAARAETTLRMERLGLEGAKILAKSANPKVPANMQMQSLFSNALAAAGKGNPFVELAVGAMYEQGYGTARDYAKAREWYEKSAAAGYPSAMTSLGDLYEHGRGVSQDYAKAREWYEKGATAGNARAMTSLGNLYEHGWGVSQDYAKAREWYEEGAAGDAGAMNNLGNLYFTGRGVTQNYVKAYEWFEKAAEGGNAVSMGWLGFLYANGRGVSQNYAKARELYEKGAAAGNAYSMNNLGNLYLNGQGVSQDYAKAREWLEKAAAAGYSDAMLAVSGLFASEKGGAADYAKALKWAEAYVQSLDYKPSNASDQTKQKFAKGSIDIEWTALFTRDFVKSLAAAARAHEIAPDNLMVETNHAHALMFLGRTDEARALYLSHRDEKLSADDPRTWRQGVLDDFKEFRKAGLPTPPLMAEIEAAFAQPAPEATAK